MSPQVTVICGGVGAARMLGGLVQVVPPELITAVINVGDDTVLHGLHISPDIDTIIYTLAGEINTETGWGLTRESWQAQAMLDRLGGLTWFQLGDRDLGTHLYRTHRLHEGATLSQITTELASSWGLESTFLPASDDRVATKVTTADEGEIGFQDYFVRRHHDVDVSAVRFEGASSARPAAGVLAAIESAEIVVIAPSNPIVSIGPTLAIPGIADALAARRSSVVAVSPIVAGSALKGPAARLLTNLGHESSVIGVAAIYRDVAGTLVIDEADATHARAVDSAGMAPRVAPTVMSDPDRAAALARLTLEGTEL